MPWHPPVPFGAFYSKEALQLGPALSLLGYCYDKVQKESGGWFRLNLHTAAGDMEVPYPTVKRWWESLRKTTYIADYIERGRSGMDVLMSGDWLDWWRDETRSKMIPNGRETGQKRDRNGTEIASEMIPNTNAYKVPNNTDQTGGSEDRDGTAHTHPPAVALFFEIFPDATISQEQGDDVCSTVGNLAFWRRKLLTWRTNGYKPRIGNLLDSYRKDLEKEERSGTRQNGQRPIVTSAPTDALDGTLTTAETAARLRERQRSI